MLPPACLHPPHRCLRPLSRAVATGSSCPRPNRVAVVASASPLPPPRRLAWPRVSPPRSRTRLAPHEHTLGHRHPPLCCRPPVAQATPLTWRTSSPPQARGTGATRPRRRGSSSPFPPAGRRPSPPPSPACVGFAAPNGLGWRALGLRRGQIRHGVLAAVAALNESAVSSVWTTTTQGGTPITEPIRRPPSIKTIIDDDSRP